MGGRPAARPAPRTAPSPPLCPHLHRHVPAGTFVVPPPTAAADALAATAPGATLHAPVDAHRINPLIVNNGGGRESTVSRREREEGGGETRASTSLYTRVGLRLPTRTGGSHARMGPTWQWVRVRLGPRGAYLRSGLSGIGAGISCAAAEHRTAFAPPRSSRVGPSCSLTYTCRRSTVV